MRPTGPRRTHYESAAVPFGPDPFSAASDQGLQLASRLEAVSRLFEDFEEAGHLDEAQEQIGVTFVTSGDSTEGFEPGDRALVFSALSVTTHLATVQVRTFAVASSRADQLDAAASQAFSQGLAVGRFVVQQMSRTWEPNEGLVQLRFDQMHFGFRGGGHGN